VTTRETLSSEGAPRAIGPYSQAVRAGGFIFVSGQIPIDRVTGEVISGGIGPRTEAVLMAAAAILEDAGSGLGRAVKVTVYMTDLGSFAEMNEVYSRFFPEDPPARAAVQVAALPKGVDIEIDVIALA
jgi:2-iminobutanoate/2-iminopropanoate deaminase